MKSLAATWRTYGAALRMLLVLTVILGIGYPLVVTAVAQLPGLNERADGSPARSHATRVGSELIAQPFTDAQGRTLARYFQPRPSAAGSSGYEPTASGAGNLGPESVVDVLANPAVAGDTGRPSLLTQVCSRSLAIGRLDGVDGSRPYCTADGVGAVLGVFWSGPGYHGRITRVVSLNQTGSATPFLRSYQGLSVQLARYGEDYSHAQIVPVRGDAPDHPAVPPDAVTASGSGLDPDISPANAAIQVARVAAARGVTPARIVALVHRYTRGRELGFLGEPTVDVLGLNIALDADFPVA